MKFEGGGMSNCQLLPHHYRMSSRPLRVQNKSEDEIIKDILSLQRELLRDHKTPSLFSLSSKYGQLHFGSDNAVEKFRSEFDDDWEETFATDGKELADKIQNHNESLIGFDIFNHARGSLLPDKLPCDVELMVLRELWTWLTKEILKEHWLKNGKSKCVGFGDPSFEPSFWLGNIWPWVEVNKHPRDLPKTAYKGPGNMTEYLKLVVKNVLSKVGINPHMWVKESFTDEKRKRRLRNRKKSAPIDDHGETSDHHDDTDSDDDDDDEQQMNENVAQELDHGTNDATEEQETTNANNVYGNAQNGNSSWEPMNDEVLNDTFAQEVTMENNGDEQSSTLNLSQLLTNNEIDLNNLSDADMNKTFATSTLQRRVSKRQAEKRARQQQNNDCTSFPRPFVPPRLLSPISEPLHTSPCPGPSSTEESPPPSPPPKASRPRFVPRRKPIGNPNQGCSNFRSKLNVDVGQSNPTNPIADMHLPRNLITEFGQLSKENSDNGLETGGVLAGKQEDDGHFQVTHLIIPEQTAKADFWQVHDERQLTNYLVYNDLIMLGLIHTHPRMTSFLSSVDLHALFDYARDNPSLISIVLAPEKNTAPIFCLTRRGLSELGKCKETGFHKHVKDDSLFYEKADHVLDDQTMDATIVDYRILRS